MEVYIRMYHRGFHLIYFSNNETNYVPTPDLWTDESRGEWDEETDFVVWVLEQPSKSRFQTSLISVFTIWNPIY